MEPYDVPVVPQFRPAIEAVAARLAAGDLDALVHAGLLAPHAVAPTAALLERNPQPLAPLPQDWWQNDGAFMFPLEERGEWCALLPLWTADGPCDVWVEVDLHTEADTVRVVIERVFSRASPR
ncbi:hypothetical protein [Actinoplanes sp. URMC 104]|uniref:hypothetical protein n=1 Tax=Actinoplanes sp. URMC 104 TaxID=3423409 RepID=UPI003F1B83D4